MKYGARKGKMNFWRQWLAKAASRELVIFPVPGIDLLRMYQSEPLNGEVRLAASPKEANVLLAIGDLSAELAERAAIVYAQMPRPRVLVMAGPDHLDPLPHPDVHVALEKDFLQTVLPAVRECLSNHAWMEEPEPYQPEALVNKIEEAGQQQGHMHDHGGHDHSSHGAHDHAHEGHQHGGHEGHEHHHEEHDPSAHQHGNTEEGHNHDHGNHDHGHLSGHKKEGHDHSHEDHKNHDHSHSGEAEAGESKGCHGATDKPGHDHGTHDHDHSQHTKHQHEGHSHSHGQQSGEKKDSHSGHDHGAHQHGEHGHEGHEHSGHQHGEHSHGHEGHSHEEHDHSQHEEHGHSHGGHDHGAHQHGDHGHGGHDHGSGFMSMIAMTKDLPRSTDGLPMEWSDVQFGPFHPGLPGGLRLSMKLDGDTVAEAEADQELPSRNLLASIPEDPAALPEYLEAINPMAPVTYRLLAQKALLNFSDEAGNSALTLSEAVLLEKERITSHLNWLAVFASTLGSSWMRDQAIKHYHLFQNGIGNMEQLSGFIRRIKKMPYLKLKLSVAVHPPGGTEKHNQEAAGTHKDHNHEHHHGAQGHGEDDHKHHEEHGHSHEMHQHTGHETHDHHEHVHHDHASKDEKNKVTGAVPGQLPDDITGPVARAAGIEKDHRLEEAVYQQAGWTPVTAAGNNAWSRLMVRLDEIEQSLRFIEKAGNDSGKESSRKINIPSVGMGNGIAHIESPRGIVTLKFHIHEGKLAHMHLTTPSMALAGLVKPVTEQQELADALIAVNSLDISPWEINP